jgi:adenine-specific DNA-methyltransferase
MSESNLSKFKSLLAELFMFDQADLDFGIYRIMNAKRDEITRFLDNDLLPQVKQSLAELESGDRAQIEAELAKAIEQANELGVDPETSSKVKQLREQLVGTADIEAIESEVFSHLYEFFRRYYSEGDFLSLRRYKAGVYAIPYEGEEVKLHWANADQYYIKTTENFRDYAFKLSDGRRIHFKIVEADTEANNNKAADGNERRFILSGDDPISEVNGELVIKFEYRPDAEKRKQTQLNDTARQMILSNQDLISWTSALASKAPTEKNTNRTVLEKHLTEYTARNTFDYFIHKDLGGFLRRELDFYIKNEVMYLDDIESASAPHVERYLSKIKAMRRIAHKVIDFLEQLENFQKKLWLKKKFVVETNYCVTLDRVPEELYPEIAVNNAQREEWVRLFAIDEITKDLNGPDYSVPLTTDFLKANPFLVIDTKYFDESFKQKFLASLIDLDDEVDGLLIHSENFQAINLLRARYSGQLKCIYIDPPYNTSATPILYKNNYKDSSWMSLIQDRIALSATCLGDEGAFSIAIDDYELANLCKIIDQRLPGFETQKVVVNHYPGSGTGRSNVSRTHEYNLFVLPNASDTLRGEPREDGMRERGFRRSGTGENNYRTGRENSFFAILVDPSTFEVKGLEQPPPLNGGVYPTANTPDGFVRVYPIGEDGSERVWSLSYEGGLNALRRGLLRASKNLVISRLYPDSKARNLLQSVWTSKKFNATTFGTNLLTDMFGQSGLFSYPKSLYTVAAAIDSITFETEDAIVFDYFAGSGTTGHAVIALNRENGTERKYILVESEEYFQKVTKPRIQKAIYSKEWQNGKPASRDGSSHFFKYIYLESYEDTLNNLILNRTSDQTTLLDQHNEIRQDYTLRYMLETETRESVSLLNCEQFTDPFNYKLNVSAGSVGETRTVDVDLVETFNYLLGLRVKHIDSIGEFRIVEGTNPDGDKVLVIWRNTKEKSNADLDTFFQKQAYRTGDTEFDLIYVNGDNNLENLRRPDETWKVRLIEQEFHRLMFDAPEV